MTVIYATPDATTGHVYVDVNAADLAGVICLKLVRVHSDGSEHTVRPQTYLCPELGEYQRLSGGRAVWWDTEAPLDEAFSYRVLTADLEATTLLDAFQRIVASGAGTADTGQTWSEVLLTAPGSTSVDGVGMRTSLGATATSEGQQASGPVLGQSDMYVTAWSDQAANGAAITWNAYPLYAGTLNWARVVAAAASGGGAVSLTLQARYGAGTVTLAGPTAAGFSLAAGDKMRIRVQVQNGLFRAKAWKLPGAEPGAWLVSVASTGITAGSPAVSSSLAGGWAGTLPLLQWYDDLQVTGTPFSMTSASLTLESGGQLWLRDPLAPCNDRRIGLCWPPRPDCVAGDDVFFAAIDADTYAAQGSLFSPNDAAQPISVTRVRRDASSSLLLVARTFDARDLLKETLAPGHVLQLVGGEAWGVDDRYMDVQDAPVSRLSQDHRFEPRAFTLPHQVVARPVGPGLGVCGARVEDLCDGAYPTWQSMTDAGISWAVLVSGVAGGAPAVYARTYTQLDAQFTDYAAMTASLKTYSQLSAGT